MTVSFRIKIALVMKIRVQVPYILTFITSQDSDLMPAIVDVALVALVALAALAHVVLCPFAKVEESFNLQAAHDLLLLGPAHVAEFDHVAFPGVVPRTFIGALVLAALTSPAALVLRLMGARRIALQVLVRGMLALTSVAALALFARSVGRVFGRDAARAFLLLCASQFHLLFYAGRTLPNVFALVLVLCAYAAWLEVRWEWMEGYDLSIVANDGDAVWRYKGRWKRVVYLLSFTTIVFRGDTAVLFAPILLSMLLARPAAFLSIIGWGLSASALSLAFTVLVDSYFWCVCSIEVWRPLRLTACALQAALAVAGGRGALVQHGAEQKPRVGRAAAALVLLLGAAPRAARVGAAHPVRRQVRTRSRSRRTTCDA